MSYIKFISLASVAVVVVAVYLHEYHITVLADILSTFPLASGLIHSIYKYIIPGQVQSKYEIPPSQLNEESLLLTSRQLQLYDGRGGTERLYLSILGQIFDVTKGKKHYGEGGGYSFFTGRDASRAFVTGDFTETGLSDDIVNLSPRQLKGVKEWLTFYAKEYKCVGKLIGRFYDFRGYKTPYLIQVENIIQEEEMKERENEEEKRKYPPCNTEWSASKGGRVWCSNKSGGITREWVGVPRKLFVLGSPTPRCVCVMHPNESNSEEPSLNNPKLEEYPGCHKDAISCSIKT